MKLFKHFVWVALTGGLLGCLGCSKAPEASSDPSTVGGPEAQPELRAAAAEAPGAEPGDSSVPVKHVDPEEAEKLLAENKQIVVLDIRTPREFSSGHIAGATNVNYNDPQFAKNLAALDKKRAYLVHCASGGRSTKSLEVLKEQGFENIYHLDGGLNLWKSVGKPVVK